MTTKKTEILAENSLRWVDGEKFVFLWDNELIAMHFDRMRAMYFFISEVDDETRQEIANWLQPKLQDIIEEEIEETKEETEDEESGH